MQNEKKKSAAIKPATAKPAKIKSLVLPPFTGTQEKRIAELIGNFELPDSEIIKAVMPEIKKLIARIDKLESKYPAPARVDALQIAALPPQKKTA